MSKCIEGTGRALFKSMKDLAMKNRFYPRVLVPNDNGCMLWIGAKNTNGYGEIINEHTKPKRTYAHRFSYYLHYGKYDKNLFVLHKCDNPSCVAPEHLFLGTQKDNMLDAKNKNRMRTKPRKGVENPAAKLNTKDIKKIRELCKQGLSSRKIGMLFNISKTNVLDIKNNKTWRHVT